MKKKIIIISICIVVLLSAIFIYKDYNREYDLIINDEVVLTASNSKMKEKLDEQLMEYQLNLVEQSRNEILELESKYIEDIDFDKIEEIEVIQLEDYTYEITITHSVIRVVNEEMPFERETVEDSSKYTSYKEITTPGVAGNEETTFSITYVNGEYQNSTSETITVDAVTEITTVGTKSIPGSSGGSSSGGNTSGSSSGSSSGGNASQPTNKLWYYEIDGYGWGSTGYSTETACYTAVQNFKWDNPQITGSYGCYQR